MTATWSSLGARSVRSVQGTTEAAPTLTTEGVALNDVLSVVPIVTAPAGQTFTGVGSMLAYVYPQGGTAWVRAPHADVDLDDVALLAVAALPTLPVTSPTGRFALIAAGVGLSSGSSLTVDFVCTTRRGDAA